MQQNKTTIPRKFAYAIGFVIFVVLLVLAIRFPFSESAPSPNAAFTGGSNLIAGSPEKFALLSGQSSQRSVGST